MDEEKKNNNNANFTRNKLASIYKTHPPNTVRIIVFVHVYVCPDHAAVLHDDKCWQINIIFDPGVSI